MASGLVSRQNIPSLTGLRGIATILVVMFHTGFPPIRGGSLGVDIFFVLSGFLITSIIIEERERTGKFSFRRFYLKRALRLAPALGLLLSTFLILAALFSFPCPIHEAWDEALVVSIYMSNWTRAFVYYAPEYMGHTWSLSVEEQFYVLWPCILIMILRLSSNRARSLTVLMLLLTSVLVRCWLTFHGASIDRIYNGLDTRGDAILSGALLAIILNSVPIEKLKSSKIQIYLRYLTPISAVMILAIAAFVSEVTKTGFYYVYTIVQALTAIIILDCLYGNKGPVKAFLSSKLMVWLGTISYGLYLWHYPIFLVAYLHKAPHYLQFFYGGFIATIIAAASYYLVEVKFLRLKNSIDLSSSVVSSPLIQTGQK